MDRVLLFDGLCNLCNGTVNFILKRDKFAKYKFASLQSGVGNKLCKQHNIDITEVDSIVLIKDETVFIKSAAVLEIFKDMPKGWRLLRVGVILPKVLLDWLYDVIAKYRYRIFGRKDECPIPAEDIQDRFLG